ncbi:N-acetyl-gamma-glutamyl-phosphate reductase [Actinoplanes sp. SE50]|uniref:N-acetyl-gamma-glutamyl-phosphate reductase n=1 Tax=unclassified Actinoplanes TaxID=2626549 RepID=UPI00023EDFE9|nr:MULTISPECIES: N-acetyl-gamma-glutamyl-phosphate reductase [unclassified Actinoplanes]AEV88370.1 N-acetyl-gamma-glutamyl-phosphate reductase [Actinoplanes sp. SE50/110]ATO86775.1 N-acetyl-gamma-glutamyl-phosphate reductase [Actinoplanes sp. SE50]SLM04193.1 N-acetyl-gamma-glutamyl-phosphate reductase [Actinoplanes sp. SE50/110]
MAEQRIRVAIAGASGYTGGELARLLLDHPAVELAFLSSERHAGLPVAAQHPALRNHPGVAGLKFRPLDELPETDVAFACLPTGALPARLGLLAERAKRVLNLAGDYRLADPAEIRTHYPATAEHPAPAPFRYVVPELTVPLPDSRFVNLPGCMAVASVYALYPALRHDLVQPGVVVDAKTGSTGGGRNSTEQHADRAGNFRVHKLHGHRHGPEIRQALADLAGSAPDLQFSAHSLDVPRGILVTGYARLRSGVTSLEVKRAYAQAYIGKPFVRVRPAPKAPQDFPMLKAVVGSNVAEVAIAVQGDRLVAVAALDNLIKGASGQAIQVMNLQHGLPETTGLPLTAAAP